MLSLVYEKLVRVNDFLLIESLASPKQSTYRILKSIFALTSVKNIKSS